MEPHMQSRLRDIGLAIYLAVLCSAGVIYIVYVAGPFKWINLIYLAVILLLIAKIFWNGQLRSYGIERRSRMLLGVVFLITAVLSITVHAEKSLPLVWAALSFTTFLSLRTI
jgi:hypothetical protein